MTMSLHDLIFKGIWLKLTSLVAAVCIWLTVATASRREMETANYLRANLGLRTFQDLPVVVVSPTADVRGVKVKPDRVAVTVRGDAARIEKLQAKDLQVMLEMTDVEAVPGLRRQVGVTVPPGVMLVRVEPDFVDVIAPPKP